MKRVFVIGMLLCLYLSVYSQSVGDGIHFLEGEKWEKILQMAQKQNKYIFMDCYTVWCGPCKALSKEIFTKKEVGDFFNANFINVKYDMEKGEGEKLHARYGENIIGFPTLLLINKKGEIVHRMAGFQKADVLIAGMRAGMEGKGLFDYQNRYDNGERSLAFLKEYINALKGAFLKDDIKKLMNDYLKNLPLEKLQEQEIWDFVSEYIKDPYSPHFSYVISNMDKLARKLKLDRYAIEKSLHWQLDKAVNVIVRLKKDEKGRILPYTDETAKLDSLKALIDRTGYRGAEGQRLKMKIYGYELAGDWNKVYEYLTVGRDIVRVFDGYTNDVLQYAALQCSDSELLEKFLLMAEEMQKKEESNTKSNFKVNYYDTLAMLYEKVGDKENARLYRTKYEEERKEIEKEFEQLLKRDK